MRQPYQSIGRWAFLGATGLFLVTQGLYLSGICFNSTRSMPVGIYKRSPLNPQTPIQRGMLVSFCPISKSAFELALKRHYLAPGACLAGQVQPLLKPVAAIPGDIVTVAPQGIAVNGRWIQSSQAQSRDSQGRVVQKMLQGTYKVNPHEVWLISSHSPRSFDSRYFGPIPLSQIQWIVRPILTGDD